MTSDLKPGVAAALRAIAPTLDVALFQLPLTPAMGLHEVLVCEKHEDLLGMTLGAHLLTVSYVGDVPPELYHVYAIRPAARDLARRLKEKFLSCPPPTFAPSSSASSAPVCWTSAASRASTTWLN